MTPSRAGSENLFFTGLPRAAIPRTPFGRDRAFAYRGATTVPDGSGPVVTGSMSGPLRPRRQPI